MNLTFQVPMQYCSSQQWTLLLPPNISTTERCFHFGPAAPFFPVQFSSIAQSCPTLCDPMNRSTPGLPVHHHLPEFTQTHVQSIESVMPSSHLILGSPLLLLPPISPSIRVFSNESALRMRCSKYWSFSFSIIPSKGILSGVQLQ